SPLRIGIAEQLLIAYYPTVDALTQSSPALLDRFSMLPPRLFGNYFSRAGNQGSSADIMTHNCAEALGEVAKQFIAIRCSTERPHQIVESPQFFMRQATVAHSAGVFGRQTRGRAASQ